MSTTTDVDVVIAGMGPVGKMMGLMLGRRGYSVLIADKQASQYMLPRAVAHDAEVARIFQAADMHVDKMPDAFEVYNDVYLWVNAERKTIFEVDWTAPDPQGWQTTYFYGQPNMEQHLDKRMHGTGNVEAHWNTEVVFAGQDESSVTVTLKNVASGESRNVRAKYLLGADGANSDTRKSQNISWNDLGYFFNWLVVDVVPGPDCKVTHLALQIADPKRPTTVVPGGPGRRRWEFMLLPDEKPEELDNEENIWRLLSAFDVRPDNAKMERHTIYRFESAWATQWRNGRVFIMGDAAHKMPPFAGQGLASGVRDVMNLAWKLDLVMQGKAKDALLDTYTSERSVHIKDMIDFSIALGSIICIPDEEAAAARDAKMLADIEAGVEAAPPPKPRLGEGLWHGETGGYLSWQGRVTTAAHPTPDRFDDVMGPGALVLRDAASASELSAETVAELTGLGIVVVTVDPQGSGRSDITAVADVDNHYANWFVDLNASAALIRPDFYVYGSASSATEVAKLAQDFIHEVTGK